MKFIVRFEEKNYNNILTLEKINGLNALKYFKEATGLPNYPYEDLQGIEAWHTSCYEIIITEEQAKETGLFENTEKFMVTCEGTTFLNGFIDKDEPRTTKTETGEVKPIIAYGQISRYVKIDDEKLYQAWKGAGFPTKWENKETV